jgi:predicted signal transduction protein with EAL and GGDEF domain
MNRNPYIAPVPLIWCPKLLTVSKSALSKAWRITMTFFLQFSRNAGAKFASGCARTRVMSVSLREGCTEAQGYFFSKPKPASDVLMLLSKQRVIAKAAAAKRRRPVLTAIGH